MGAKPNEIIYLACPYTHSDPQVMEERYNIATKLAAYLIEKRKLIVFSPITMTHPIDKLLARDSITLGSDYWLHFDELFMKACAKMIVLTIDGWQQSEGIQREIEAFKTMGKEVEYLNPSDLMDGCTKDDNERTKRKLSQQVR